MVKKRPPSENNSRPLHIEVEEWRWQTPSSSRFSWKHWLAGVLLFALALLFAFGFLMIAGIMVVVGCILGLVFFLLKRLP